MFVSFVQRLYKTGASKIDCVVLRCEGTDVMALNQVRSTRKPPTNTKVPASRNSEWFLSLYHIDVVTNAQQVVNVLATSEIRNGLKAQARNGS